MMKSNHDKYTQSPNRVRIFRDEMDDGLNWNVDGVDSQTGRYTEAYGRFPTWPEAVAAIPEFVEFHT